MDATTSRRILVVGAPDAAVLPFVKELTGSAPEPVNGSTAGLIHSWKLSTAYYQATIPIWIDEIQELHGWLSEFSSPDAGEAVTAVGAWVYCFRKPVGQEERQLIQSTLEGISKVVKLHGGYGWDGAAIALSTVQQTVPHLPHDFEEWDELCRSYGFEYVDGESQGRNEYHEPQGVSRVREALESNDWLMDADVDEESGQDAGLAVEQAEINSEFGDLRMHLHRDTADGDTADGDEPAGSEERGQVDALGGMVQQLTAIKESSAGLGESERKRIAAKAVNDLMRRL